MNLREKLIKLVGKNVDFAIAGSTHQGILRKVEEDHLIFFRDGNESTPTFFVINNIIWIREADKQP